MRSSGRPHVRGNRIDPEREHSQSDERILSLQMIMRKEIEEQLIAFSNSIFVASNHARKVSSGTAEDLIFQIERSD